MQALNLDLLEEIEINEYEEKKEEYRESFKVRDLNQASWAFRKLSAYQKKEKEINDLAEEELNRINEWRDREINSLKKSISFFESLLENYLYELREIDPNAKVSTPYGSVGSRKQKVKWNVDKEKLVEWLKSNNRDDLIKVKEEPSLSSIQKEFSVVGDHVVDGDGVIVSGINIEEQEDKINIKVK